jgi:hypothetical protein
MECALNCAVSTSVRRIIVNDELDGVWKELIRTHLRRLQLSLNFATVTGESQETRQPGVFLWGKALPARKADNLIAICERIVYRM